MTSADANVKEIIKWLDKQDLNFFNIKFIKGVDSLRSTPIKQSHTMNIWRFETDGKYEFNGEQDDVMTGFLLSGTYFIQYQESVIEKLIFLNSVPTNVMIDELSKILLPNK